MKKLVVRTADGSVDTIEGENLISNVIDHVRGVYVVTHNFAGDRVVTTLPLSNIISISVVE